MAIRPFLSGRAFDPEIIDKMSEALKGVCETLSLNLADGPETRLVAQKTSLPNVASGTLLRFRH